MVGGTDLAVDAVAQLHTQGLAPHKQTHMAQDPQIDENATDILALTCGIKAMAGRINPDNPSEAVPDILMDIARMLAGADVHQGWLCLGQAAAMVAQIAVTNGVWTVDEVVRAFRAFLVTRVENPEPS